MRSLRNKAGIALRCVLATLALGAALSLVPFAMSQQSGPFQWWVHTNDPTRSYLYMGDRMIGAWDHVNEYWRSWDSRRGWGPKDIDPPIPAPDSLEVHLRVEKTLRAQPLGKFVFGVDRRPGAAVKRPEPEKYSYKGTPVSREQIDQIMKKSPCQCGPGCQCEPGDGCGCSHTTAMKGDEKGGRVIDDSKKARLTIIAGDKATRDKVKQDIKTSHAFDGLRDNILVWDGPETDWSFDCGFPKGGNPTIIYQAPDGTVLHRQSDYNGPDELAAAVRKASPNYDPARDPDQRKLALIPKIHIGTQPGSVWLVAIVACVLLYLWKKVKARPVQS